MANAWQINGKALQQDAEKQSKHTARTGPRNGKSMANRWQAMATAKYRTTRANAWQTQGREMANAWQTTPNTEQTHGTHVFRRIQQNKLSCGAIKKNDKNVRFLKSFQSVQTSAQSLTPGASETVRSLAPLVGEGTAGCPARPDDASDVRRHGRWSVGHRAMMIARK